MNGFAILSVATGASNPSIIGTVKGNLNAMKYAMYLSYYPGGKLLFVSGYESDSLCVADVSDPSSPTVLDWETSSTYMDGARGVAFDPVTRNVLVAAQNSDSLAVLNLTGTITGAQDARINCKPHSNVCPPAAQSLHTRAPPDHNSSPSAGGAVPEPGSAEERELWRKQAIAEPLPPDGGDTASG